MILRENKTENIATLIMWQYFRYSNDTMYYIENDSCDDNVMFFDIPYDYYGESKRTEIGLFVNGIKFRVDCKYLSKNSNFADNIISDMQYLTQCTEKNIMFVIKDLTEGGNKKLKLIKDIIINQLPYNQKNYHFVDLENLNEYISNNFNLNFDSEKRSRVSELIV